MFFIFFLLILSAFLYSTAFIFIDKLWYLIFFFITPISYLVLEKKYSIKFFNKSFRYGLFWGIIAFFIQPIGLYISLINIAQHNKIFIAFMIFLLTIYQAIYSGFWVYITSKISSNLSSDILKILLFSIITWGYFNFIENYLLWPFSESKIEGVFIFNPLLPLAVNSSALYLMSFLDQNIFLFILILYSSILSLIFIYKNIAIKLFILFIFISPFIFNIFFKDSLNNNLPEIFNHIAAISKAFYNPGDNKRTALEIAKEINDLKNKKKDIKIILFPESAFYLCDLKQEQELINYFNKDIHIIIGAIRKKRDKYYNALYYLHNNKIISKFYKRHSLILTERLLFKKFNLINKLIKNSYFKERPIITESNKERVSFNISKNIKLIPYICSEIFFNNNPDDKFNNNSIVIALCNDTWIYESVNYIQKLMVMANKLKAMHWKRYIIYVDYQSAYIFNKYGNQQKLIF